MPLRHGQRHVDALRLAGKDDLAGAVEVGHVHVRVGGHAARDVFLRADERRHGARAGLAGFFHEPAARLDELQPVLERERARRRVRGEFAQRKPRRRRHREIAHLRAQGRQRGEAVDEKRGLAVGGQRELVQRAFERQRGKRSAERRVGLLEKCGRGGRVRGEFAAHADGLRALPGKEESNVICHPGVKKILRFCQKGQ